MDPRRWAQITDKARQEESAARARSFDPARMPFPAAVNTRLMCELFDRVEALEQSLGVTAKPGDKCKCGSVYSLAIEAGVTVGCQPGHCAVEEGRRSPEDAKKDRQRDKDTADALKALSAIEEEPVGRKRA